MKKLLRNNLFIVILFLISCRIMFDLIRYGFDTFALILAGLWLVIFFMKIVDSFRP